MQWSHQSAPWNSFIPESLFYLIPGLITHAAFFVLSLILIQPFTRSRFYPNKISTILIFNLVFLFVSMTSNGFWSCSVWGYLYFSTDYISDFSPFYPIRQSVIDMTFGEQVGSLNKITLVELNWIWSLYAISTWSLSYFLTRIILSKSTNKNG